jgi:glycosyltransferase involved in cell wall biosynthesis
LVPLFNERERVRGVLEGVFPYGPGEIIVVDDGSTDGSGKEVQKVIENHPPVPVRLFTHLRNQGKGASIRTALKEAIYPIVIIHDADGEYDPADWEKGVRMVYEGKADLVVGSRFKGEIRRALYPSHHLANRFLTWLVNILNGLDLSDVEAGMKIGRTDFLRSLSLQSNDFRIEVEVVIRAAKVGGRIFEMPIRYYGRTYREGKKIRFKDGILALWGIFWFSLRW